MTTDSRRVAMVEFPIYDQLPLVSGYLTSYVRLDPSIASAFEFVYYQKDVERATYTETLDAIRALHASIICFSCYVWNMGLVRRLVEELSRDASVDKIVLGGHQITHHIGKYVEPTNDKVIVVNGQGEIPFRALLQGLLDPGEPPHIAGLSFFTHGELWDGGEAPMLTNLDDIPSPFLGGCFDGMSSVITIFETNRGCPYKCTFCTWGGDTLKVTKFSLDRVKEELRWIAKKQIMYLYLADANWGMMPRDPEISEYIAQLKKDHGYPLMVSYAAAKNKPKGSIECIQKLHDGGVITSQALGIQSMNPDTLSLVDRQNIKNQAFIEMFQELKARNIDSYCELIWPLPGETLGSLKAGFEQLMQLGAHTTIMYPALLINNARLTEQISEHAMETLACEDWRSELKLVKKTKSADRAAVDDGFWFYYSYFLLANCDLHKGLLSCLHEATGKRTADIISAFSDYLRRPDSTSSYASLIRSIFKEEAHGSLLTIGRVASHLTHEARTAAQLDVCSFVTEMLPNDPERALAISALSAFSLPLVFQTTVENAGALIEGIDRLGRARGCSWASLAKVESSQNTTLFRIRGATGLWAEVARAFGATNTPAAPVRLQVVHPAIGRMPYTRDKTRNFVYAHGMIHRLGYISPRVGVGVPTPEDCVNP